MNLLRRLPLHGSIFALALTAAALLVSLFLRPYLEPNTFLLFLVAVWLSAWFHGRAGGLLATVASAFAMGFLFLQHDLSLSALSRSVSGRLFAFTGLAAVVAWETAAWRESRRLLASTLTSIGDAVLVTDREGRIRFMNAPAEALTGWALREARSKPVTAILHLLNAKTREAVENPLAPALLEHTMVAMEENTILVSRSGAEAPVEYTAAPVRDELGKLLGGILTFRDITQRRRLDEQAAHVEKMEAVSRLAGGVAGDFNNVLTMITGYAELLRAEVPVTSPLRRFVDEVIFAGERAAALSRHLLAFSRGSSAPAQVLDLNSVIAGMEPMLRRLLGDNIELTLIRSTGLGHIRAEPAQIEQVIVNLSTNSREAMPGGGKLVLETANVEVDESAAVQNLGVKPGSYVMLAVSDTGVGMEPETRSRLFEPFFTTKEPGKGSGLGLAMVYGAIKQSDGQVTVYSQPGCGTIFEIYLPRVAEPVTEPVKRGSGRGSETILLVDDEEGVRKLVCAILRSNGYDVLEANNATTALAVFEKNAHKIDLVLTDVVMPQTSGLELGRQLAGQAPALKILFMSGYRENSTGMGGEMPRPFLHKPFTPDVLLARVREVLDAETV